MIDLILCSDSVRIATMTKESTAMTMLLFIIAVVMDAKESCRTNTVQHSTAAWDNSWTNSIETFDIIHIFFYFHMIYNRKPKKEIYSAKSHTLMYLFNKKKSYKISQLAGTSHLFITICLNTIYLRREFISKIIHECLQMLFFTMFFSSFLTDSSSPELIFIFLEIDSI